MTFVDKILVKLIVIEIQQNPLPILIQFEKHRAFSFLQFDIFSGKNAATRTLVCIMRLQSRTFRAGAKGFFSVVRR